MWKIAIGCENCEITVFKEEINETYENYDLA